MLAALLLIPIGVLTALLLSSADDQTTAVQEIVAVSSDVHDDLDLLQAVRVEVLSSSWVTIERQFPEFFADADSQMFAEMLATAQQDVDALLDLSLIHI